MNRKPITLDAEKGRKLYLCDDGVPHKWEGIPHHTKGAHMRDNRPAYMHEMADEHLSDEQIEDEDDFFVIIDGRKVEVRDA